MSKEPTWCHCECHKHGVTAMHFVPCCDLDGEKYIYSQTVHKQELQAAQQQYDAKHAPQPQEQS